MADQADVDLFHDAVNFGLEIHGLANLQLKEKQYEVLKCVALENKDVLAALPTGYGKSLIYQLLPPVPVFDFLGFGGKPTEKKFTFLVISPLHALIRDQIVKMREVGLSVCILKGNRVVTEEDDGEETSLVSVPLEMPRKEQFELIFAHPEVMVDNKNVSKVLKSPAFKERVKAIVVDEAHLVVDWYVEIREVLVLRVVLYIYNNDLAQV